MKCIILGEILKNILKKEIILSIKKLEDKKEFYNGSK